MQITLQSILANLLSVQSEELMNRHLADERFLSVWNTYMVCRFLSFSPFGIDLLPALDEAANIKDPKVAYPMLMGICKGLKFKGQSNRASSYRQSPFTD